MQLSVQLWNPIDCALHKLFIKSADNASMQEMPDALVPIDVPPLGERDAYYVCIACTSDRKVSKSQGKYMHMALEHIHL